MHDVLLATAALAVLAAALAALLLVAEYFLANYGECKIDVNRGERKLTVKGGASLLASLAEKKIFIPSACGGRGSCGFCKCRVIAGGGPVLPTELPYLGAKELAAGMRLSCQVKVKGDLEIEVPPELLSVREFQATVEKIENLTYDIKRVRFALRDGETVSLRAGQYVQFVAPPYGEVHDPTSRAYSVASSPSDRSALDLIIRLVPNGIVTTYVFTQLREGAAAKLTGPFGDFFLRDSDRECIFIAGGSGLAPFRSMLFDMVEKGIKRKTTFFFGANLLKDLYYVEELKELERQHDWFRFVPALSGSDTGHDYETGLITDVVGRHYGELDRHEAYLCGSPGMIDACVRVLTGHKLPPNLIFYDKFS